MEDHFGMSILLDATLGPHSQDPPVSSHLTNASGMHQCGVCKRSYERSDHLNRHLKSHENARPFHCSRCPKRFNRADLLSRHLATHERQSSRDPDRPIIKRTDRAAEACVACVASKSKCEDQKPCGRCRTKNIPCETSTSRGAGQTRGARGSLRKAQRQDSVPTENSQTSESNPSNNIKYTSTAPSQSPGTTHASGASFSSQGQGFQGNEITMGEDIRDNIAANFEMPMVVPFFSGEIDEMSLNEMNPMLFMPNMVGFDQDLDFGIWDFNFDGVQLPTAEAHADILPTHHSNPSNPDLATTTNRDISRGYEAFKRSPWLWTPALKDRHLFNSEHFTVEDASINPDLTPSSNNSSSVETLTEDPHLDANLRDRMFAIVLKIVMNTAAKPVPQFPSLDILNHVLHVFFVRQSYQTDHWIHAPTFSTSKADPHLVLALICVGSTFISVPAIWKMGLALQEVVRLSLAKLFEMNNQTTRVLQNLQAFTLLLDVGLWSGFKRKMELAESFGQPLATMLRRGGVLAAPRDSELLVPKPSDAGERLETKWRKWVERESYKRLAIHIFLHDTRASAALQKPPLLQLSELNFSMPASRELWLADTAVKWKQKYLTAPLSTTTVPRLIDVIHDPGVIDILRGQVDINLSSLAMLHGFWGQIWSLHEGNRFHLSNQTSNRSATYRMLLTAQCGELYQDLHGFAKRISDLAKQPSGIFVIIEFFMMTLHVSPDELQRFAGKSGEEEASRTQANLQRWIQTPEARKAAWHAGQVFRAARSMPPAELRDFHAIAVYFASLALWAFGLVLSCNNAHEGVAQNQLSRADVGRTTSIKVFLDGPETQEAHGFLSRDQGCPGLSHSYGGENIFEPLNNPNMVLKIAREIYRNNFPDLEEPLPPLVENLGNLMRDLGSLPGSRFSRSGSEDIDK